MKMTKIICIILILGIVYRIFLTSNGSFLFNMDNARDMVDVREMVVLGKIRLSGPSSAIEGVFNGPGWYYLLSIPFILSKGNPYAAILMQIILWAIGGFFLLKTISKWGKLLVFPIGFLWIASNYVVLTNLYAFNPNPVILLTPLFIYLFYKYLERGNLVYILSTWFLGGLFFNYEMNFGIFIPLIILISTFLTDKNLLKKRNFWIGSLFFILTLVPQLLFDVRHNFIMTTSIINFIKSGSSSGFNILARIIVISDSFYNTFMAVLMNQRILTLTILILSILIFYKFFKEDQKDKIVQICLVYIFVPFLGYLVLPVTVNAWHLGGEMAAGIILLAFVMKKLWDFNIKAKLISLTLAIFIAGFSLMNIFNFFLRDINRPNLDPSLFKNEIAAIDYVYHKANGVNFKVYTYLPSVYDYPYQYLFWWYGKKKYGYIPGEYRYLPNKPQYIPSQDQFEGRKDNFSGLVFLIKEPNRNYTRFGWEGNLLYLEPIEKQMVGSIEIETRREIKK